MSDGPVFVERVDKAAIRSQLVKLVVLAEQADPLADDWDWWTNLIIDSGLVGVREARKVAGYQHVPGSPHIVEWLAPRIGDKEATHSRFVTEWEEVEE